MFSSVTITDSGDIESVIGDKIFAELVISELI